MEGLALVLIGTAALFTGCIPDAPAKTWAAQGAVFTAPSWASPGVLEPTVIKVADGDWRMWFRGGGVHGEGTGGEQVGYATSTDGLSWTDSGAAILGGGVGGESHPTICPHMRQFTAGGTFYLYYSDITSVSVKVAASANGYSGFTITGSGLSLPAGTTLFGNEHVLKDGSTYYMTVEAYHSADGIWKTYLASSSSPTSGFSYLNSGNPLTTLQVASGGYGSLFVPARSLTPYLGWYQANPSAGNGSSDIYWATSDDLIAWTQLGRVIQHSGTGYEVDQVADASVIESDGQTLMYVDAVDNTTGISAIELFTITGTFHLS